MAELAFGSVNGVDMSMVFDDATDAAPALTLRTPDLDARLANAQIDAAAVDAAIAEVAIDPKALADAPAVLQDAARKLKLTIYDPVTLKPVLEQTFNAAKADALVADTLAGFKQRFANQKSPDGKDVLVQVEPLYKLEAI